MATASPAELTSTLYCQLQQHVDGIAHKPTDGSTLAVASSLITGNTWDGEVALVKNKAIAHTAGTAAGNPALCWIGEHGLLVASDDGNISLLAQDTLESRAVFAEHHDTCSSVATCPSKNDCFASTSWDGSILLWQLDSPNSTSCFLGHTEPIHTVSWSKTSPDLFCTASQDCTLRLWDQRQREKCSLSIRAPDPLFCAAWSPSNDWMMASGTEGGSVLLSDIRNAATPIGMHGAHARSVRTIAFCPHSPTIIASGADDGTVALFCLDASTVTHAGKPHTDSVRCMSWGSELVTGSWDKSLRSITTPSS